MATGDIRVELMWGDALLLAGIIQIAISEAKGRGFSAHAVRTRERLLARVEAAMYPKTKAAGK